MAAAAPNLPGDDHNRAFGMRQIPIVLPEIRAFFAAAGTDGWVLADLDDPPWPGAIADAVGGVHVAEIDDALAAGRTDRMARGLTIRAVDPADRADVDRWAELFVAGFSLEAHEADVARRSNPFLAASKGEHEFIASLDGRDVAWLGVVHPPPGRVAGRRHGPPGGARSRHPACPHRGPDRSGGGRRLPDGHGDRRRRRRCRRRTWRRSGLRRIWARGRYRLDRHNGAVDATTIPA